MVASVVAIISQQLSSFDHLPNNLNPLPLSQFHYRVMKSRTGQLAANGCNILITDFTYCSVGGFTFHSNPTKHDLKNLQ